MTTPEPTTKTKYRPAVLTANLGLLFLLVLSACGPVSSSDQASVGDDTIVLTSRGDDSADADGLGMNAARQAPDTAQTSDFCATWHTNESSMMQGPADDSPEAMAEYLDRLRIGFDQLIVAARSTANFPGDALADLTAYRDAIADAAQTPADASPSPAVVMLGIRTHEFITARCDDDTTIVPGDASEDSAITEESDDDEQTQSDGPNEYCGALQFGLLVLLADDLEIDHADISQPYIDAMNALVSGADPGPEFDVSHLSLVEGNEELGCRGARAMQQLLTDLGWGPLIEGTELGS